MSESKKMKKMRKRFQRFVEEGELDFDTVLNVASESLPGTDVTDPNALQNVAADPTQPVENRRSVLHLFPSGKIPNILSCWRILNARLTGRMTTPL